MQPNLVSEVSDRIEKNPEASNRKRRNEALYVPLEISQNQKSA